MTEAPSFRPACGSSIRANWSRSARLRLSASSPPPASAWSSPGLGQLRAAQRRRIGAGPAAAAGPRRRSRRGAQGQRRDPDVERAEPRRQAFLDGRAVVRREGARARMPDQRHLLRGRPGERRRPARGRAGRPQPRPPPGLPVERLRRRLPGLDPRDRLPVHLHLRRLAAAPPRQPTAGPAPAGSRRRRWPARSTRRSAGRPIITPITCCLTGPRAWPRMPSSARTSSIAGAAAGAVRRPSPSAMPARSPTPRRCAPPRSPPSPRAAPPSPPAVAEQVEDIPGAKVEASRARPRRGPLHAGQGKPSRRRRARSTSRRSRRPTICAGRCRTSQASDRGAARQGRARRRCRLSRQQPQLALSSLGHRRHPESPGSSAICTRERICWSRESIAR